MADKLPKVGKKGRILYVEPNDVFGDVNGVPLTPDYSDMCISFNLIVEIVSRYKQTAKQGDDQSGKFSIFWTSKLGLDQAKPWVSFLGGEEIDGKSFLTTYYTDTHYEDILKKNIVEGLGIENITVAFENYYTPTVSIKFVDQRGSSLFGREEATHYNDKLTIDNIFGAFFTAPYPKFKLQIKGFYGKPVTLQLTCSGFKGNLNSQTGNFEATATFIGYSYSLLTDIPFQYIVAAPYCDYAGREYWNSRVGNKEWQPYKSNGHPMPRIYEFVEKINEALADDKLLKILTDEDNEALQAAETEKAELGKLYSQIARFISELCGMTDVSPLKNFDVEQTPLSNEQIVLFSNSQEIEITDSVSKAFEDLILEFKSYNESYSSNKLPNSSLPNECTETFPNLVCIDLFDIEETEYGIHVVGCRECSEINVDNLCEIEFNTKSDGSGERRRMERNTATLLIQKLNRDVTNDIHKYACIVDLHDLRRRVNDRMNQIGNEVDVVEQQKERDYVKLAQDKLHMVPYIGNIFKMIMCHIETLVYMMYKCYENIKEDEMKGYRDPSYLRIDITRTDTIPTNRTSVPAWPMVTRASSNNNENKSLEDENTLGWVGDFSPYFEEEKLVRALFLACKKTTNGDIDFREHNSTISYIPVTPNDINNISSVFNSSSSELSISYLAGLLGLRAAQLFGILENGSVSSEIAETMGKMDAYNLYINTSSKDTLKNKITDVSGNKSLGDKMFDIMLCSEEEDNMGETRDNGQIQVHPFETNKGIMGDVVKRQKRDPIFVQNGSNVNYVHYYTKSRFGLVPSTIMDFSTYERYFPYEGNSSNTYFNFNTTESNENYDVYDSLLFNCNTKSLCKDKVNSNRYKNVICHEKFDVVTNPQQVSGILKRYAELSTNNFKIYGDSYEEDFSKVLNRYWDVNESSYSDFFKNNGVIVKKAKEVKVNEGDNNVFDLVKGTRSYTKESFFNILEKHMPSIKKNTNEGGWLVGGESVSADSLSIPFLKIYKDKSDKKPVALFGSTFYYLQNGVIEDIADENKALLFLHSLSQRMLGIKEITAFSSDKKHGSIQAIPYVLTLLYGGLLWRHKYIEDNGKDPILYDNSIAGCSFKKPSLNGGNEGTLFFKGSGKYSKYKFGCSTTDANFYDVHINDLFGGELPDYHITNALIYKFQEFVSGDWKTIARNCELSRKLEDKKVAFDAGTFAIAVKYVRNEIKKCNSGGVDKNPAEIDYSTWFGDSVKNFSIICLEDETDTQNLFVYLKEDNEGCQRILRSLFCNKTVVVDMSNKRKSRETNEANPTGGTDISISTDTLKSYLRSFGSKLKELAEKPSNVEIDGNNDAGNPNDKDIAEFTRDVAIPIYLYLKMLWDKWLSGDADATPTNHEFMVEKFFKNFIFIDSFYRNITSRLMTNCQVFLEIYDGNTYCNEDSTVFKAIGDLTTRHHCLFLAIPDFIDNLASPDPKEAVEALQGMFTPMPYNAQPPAQRNNRFVVIYVPKLSETPSEMNNYKEDGFNIWSYNDAKAMHDTNLPSNFVELPLEDDRDLPPILKKNTGDFDSDEDMTRYGYYVPSFGLAYGYQHNHLFKNVNLNMETPVITSAVINTLTHIAKQGAANEHKIAFIGQDLYPVFSNYSYICEFEMMGCAQVQPLMYFQLMNVPMWRGTYMIFNVTHTMTPGNMVTKVKAMKLSNRAVPYSNAWFTKNMAYKDKNGNGIPDDCEEVGGVTGSNKNTSSSGDTSYDYSKYKHLVNRSGRSKYIDMDKVLEGVTTIRTNSDCKGTKQHGPHKMAGFDYKIGYNNYHHKCTAGPITWYRRGGISLDFWKDTGSPYTSKRADTWMKEQGFIRPFQGVKMDTRSRDKSYQEQNRVGNWDGLEPGDIMIIFGRHGDGGATAHGAMYTGKDWRSDCVQAQAACEAGLREPVEGGSVQIWRFDDATYEKYHPNAKPINNN